MFRRALAHLAHRLNPVTIAREAMNYAVNKFIPQGAAEISQALNHQNAAYVPYGHAQAPVRPRDTMGDIRSVQAPSVARSNAQNQNMSMGM